MRAGKTVRYQAQRHMIEKLQSHNIHQCEQGVALHKASYDSIKRRYAIFLVVNGLNPNGEPE